MSLKTSDFSYELPVERIVDQPPEQRGTTRLLALDRRSGAIKDDHYANVASYIQPGDVMILNDTKVLPARLIVHKKDSGVERELIILERHHEQEDWHRHNVLYRRRLAAGDVLITADASELTVEAVHAGGIATVRSERNLLELAESSGEVPLPPYMHRRATESDTERYQSVWAKHIGSVAAPTASLNMTEATLQSIREAGASIHHITLHVGLGTFLPIRTDDLTGHKMHEEFYQVPAETVTAIQEAKRNGKRVIAVGTTVTRTLEHCQNQILHNAPTDLHGEADIFIYPGYEFKIVDALLTNFHAPESTVLMMAAAFAGWDHLKAAYEHAISKKYAFLSYGDSMFIF